MYRTHLASIKLAGEMGGWGDGEMMNMGLFLYFFPYSISGKFDF
ncbi:MAG: hypothetical protein AAGJ08_01155 [Cyanobacteria bacterium P01_H01_bin.35]